MIIASGAAVIIKFITPKQARPADNGDNEGRLADDFKKRLPFGEGPHPGGLGDFEECQRAGGQHGAS